MSPASSRLREGQPYLPRNAAFSSAASVIVPAAAAAGNRTEANNILPHSGLGHDQITQHAQVTLICSCNASSTIPGSQSCVARFSAHLSQSWDLQACPEPPHPAAAKFVPVKSLLTTPQLYLLPRSLSTHLMAHPLLLLGMIEEDQLDDGWSPVISDYEQVTDPKA